MPFSPDVADHRAAGVARIDALLAGLGLGHVALVGVRDGLLAAGSARVAEDDSPPLAGDFAARALLAEFTRRFGRGRVVLSSGPPPALGFGVLQIERSL